MNSDYNWEYDRIPAVLYISDWNMQQYYNKILIAINYLINYPDQQCGGSWKKPDTGRVRVWNIVLVWTWTIAPSQSPENATSSNI